MSREKSLTALLLVAIAATILLRAPAAMAQTETTLHSFTGLSDGGNPLSSLLMDAAGNLYGTTFVGGTGAGAVFELSPNTTGGWTETVIYNFTGLLDGANPFYADVIFDGSGNLYGTTVEGGANNWGTVFELTPTGSGWNERVLYNFAGGLDGGESLRGTSVRRVGKPVRHDFQWWVSRDGHRVRAEAGLQWAVDRKCDSYFQHARRR